ncbi:MarR-like DNA-binding transcriptional regulator SgrR of sgrS sRNA [Enterococcus sp. UD-01]|jgi:MarR-like DNA-binding transcriptional regulator SgrR of sgrS sRNA
MGFPHIMNDINYFLLRSILYLFEKEQFVKFNLSELATSWNYSKQNTKQKIKNYEKAGLLKYTSGIGRGNLSSILFSNNFKDDVQNALITSLDFEDITFPLQLLELNIPESWFSPFIHSFHQLFEKNNEDHLDSIVLLSNKTFRSLQPHRATFLFETFLINEIGENLLSFCESSKKILPSIAIHWNHSSDFKVWNFKLRKNITFHNGERLTSSDVKASFIRISKKSNTGYWLLNNLLEIICENEHSITFKFQQSEPLFAYMIVHYSLIIQPANSLKEENLVSCGAFQVISQNRNYLKLKSFSAYFKEKPIINTIEIITIDKNINNSILLPSLNHQSSENEKKESVSIELKGCSFLIFNTMKENKKIDIYMRKAIGLIYDIYQMISDLNITMLKPINSFFSDSSLKRETQTIENLLEKSNYAGQKLILSAPNNQRMHSELNWFINQAIFFGLEIQLDHYSLEDDQYLTKLKTQSDMIIGTDISTLIDDLAFIDFLLNPFLFPANLFSAKHKKKLNILLNQYRFSITESSRLAAREEVENYIQANGLLYYLYRPMKHYQLHPDLNGVVFDTKGNIDLHKIWSN